MQEFKGKTAVVTGAASGIGRSLAQRCAQEGLRVVLADIEAEALVDVERELRASGASVCAPMFPSPVMSKRWRGRRWRPSEPSTYCSITRA